MSAISGMFKDLTSVHHARNGRLASWDQRGKNQDYWEVPAGETITLGEIEGPGCITHMWMTSSCRRGCCTLHSRSGRAGLCRSRNGDPSRTWRDLG